jgi:hypothetical protein
MTRRLDNGERERRPTVITRLQRVMATKAQKFCRQHLTRSHRFIPLCTIVLLVAVSQSSVVAMGKNKNKQSAGGAGTSSQQRRPGKGPHPKAGQGKHNKSNNRRTSAGSSSRHSIGSSAASLASREDLRSVVSEDEVVHLDDHVVGRVGSKDSSGTNLGSNNNLSNEENRQNNNNATLHVADPSPPPATVTIQTALFSPIKEEPANYVPTPTTTTTMSSNTMIHCGGAATTAGGMITKTPFNSPNLVPVVVDPVALDTPKKEASLMTTSTAPTVLMLVSASAMKREVLANQRMAETLLTASRIPFTILDGSDPENKSRRDELFGISRLRGLYPQFFRVEHANAATNTTTTTTTFVGDWDFVQSSNECGTLVRDLLGTDTVATGVDAAASNVTELQAAPAVLEEEEEAIDVWSSNLKNHVTLEPDGPAVLDVTVDEIILTTTTTPLKDTQKSPATATAAPPKIAEVTTSAMSTSEPAEQAVATTAKTATETAGVVHNARDLVVDLSAPAKDEAGQAQKDCQCVVL